MRAAAYTRATVLVWLALALIVRRAPVVRATMARSPVAACMARCRFCLPCAAVVCTIVLVAVLVAAVVRAILAPNARVALIVRSVENARFSAAE